MDIVLFFVGLYCLINRHYGLLWCIIIFLTSTYLQINIDERYHNILFPHNVSDTGAALYILFFLKMSVGRKLYFSGKLQKVTSVFLLFVLINGVFDYFLGTQLGDISRYYRHWIFLTMVYIMPYFQAPWVHKTLRYLYYLTMLACILLLFQRFTGIVLVEMRFDVNEWTGVTRGAKPPSYSIYCSILALLNIWGRSRRRQVTEFLILFSPTLLSLKMTYAITVILAYGVYLLFYSAMKSHQKVGMCTAAALAIVGFFAVSKNFAERFDDMMNQAQSYSVKAGEGEKGNFTFRLMLVQERINYLVESPSTLLRGIGYVAEKNYKGHQFTVGTRSNFTGEASQVESADIAWANLFLRLGIVGTCIFIFLFYTFYKIFHQHSQQNMFNTYASASLPVYLCFTSLGNALICSTDFFIIYILFAIPAVINNPLPYYGKKSVLLAPQSN